MAMKRKSSVKHDPPHSFAVRAMVFMLLGCGISSAEEPQKGKDIVPAKVEVRAIEIRPSYDGENYEGRFLLIHHGKDPLKIRCSERPVGRRFPANDIQYQVLKDNVWINVEAYESGWCFAFDLPPDVPCEVKVDLRHFKEQDEPLTGRVILNGDEFPSEPFVLDWKSDREAGKFLAAKKAHAERLRAAFLKSGFRPELLQGDEFPLHIVEEMIAGLIKSGEAGAWFSLIQGKIEITATIRFKGDVFITFKSSHPGRGGHYSGLLRWNPDKLNRALIQRLRLKDGFTSLDIDEGSGRPRGSSMWINPEAPIDPDTLEYVGKPFQMSLDLWLPDDAALPMPAKGAPAKALDSVVGFLEGCLTDGRK